MGKRFKIMYEGRGGWCEWIAPIPKGYLMKCCDCGLVHEMQFSAFKEIERKRDTFKVKKLSHPFRVMFRARRQRKQRKK